MRYVSLPFFSPMLYYARIVELIAEKQKISREEAMVIRLPMRVFILRRFTV